MEKRRRFIELLGRSVLDFGSGNGIHSITEDKIILLTRDGKLVEVDRSLVEKGNKTKATHKEITSWINKK